MARSENTNSPHPKGKYEPLSSNDDDEEESNIGSNDSLIGPGTKEAVEDRKEELSKQDYVSFKNQQVLKALYFIQTGAAAGLVKFLPVYYTKAHNKSAAVVGNLQVCGQITNFAGGLFWGAMADRSGAYKTIMVLTNR